MKTVFLTAEPPWPLDQGDKLRNYHLLKALAEAHAVTLVSFCAPGDEEGTWREVIGPFCEAVYAVPLGRLQMLLNVARLPHLPVTMAARASFRMGGLLRQMTGTGEFDLAFACQLKMAGYLKQCSVRRRVADLTDSLSLYRRRMTRFASSSAARLFGLIEAARLARQERRIAGLTDVVLLASASDAAALEKIAPGANVCVLANGVDLDYFRPLPDPGRPVLLFYGHLRYPPNADGLIWFCREVFPQVRKVVPEAELHIAGKEASVDVVSLARLPGVKFWGHVPDLRPCLASSSLVVVPLRFGTGIHNKVLEALAAGRAVVSTSLGYEGLEVVPGVHLEVVDKPADFAAAVVGLLRDPARRAALAAAGRRLVEERYSWRMVSQVLQSLLVGTEGTENAN
ncbi:MAG: glycosyltransferase [Firmicutes bacterium]|nr:glycosyltransferase [Bacillota bacterium]